MTLPDLRDRRLMLVQEGKAAKGAESTDGGFRSPENTYSEEDTPGPAVGRQLIFT